MYRADLDLFRSARTETLRLSQSLTQEQSQFTPAPAKWSAGEVLDHLLLSERLYRDAFARLIQLQKAGQRAVLRTSFADIDTSILLIPRSLLPLLDIPFTFFNLLTPPFVREMLTEYRLLPAQNPRIATPQNGKPITELRNDLRSSCRETETLFDNNPNLDYRKMRFSHPLMGDNNVLQVLRILSLHERRHQSQIREILKSPHFPKGG